MARIRTFIDSGVLIAAATGTDEVAFRAMSILDDPERLFVSSEFVRLEVLPKARYLNRPDEAAFYSTFFEFAAELVAVSRKLVRYAQTEAESNGLAAMDALHVAAATAGRAEELVTSEKPSKPIFRTKAVPVTSVRPGV